MEHNYSLLFTAGSVGKDNSRKCMGQTNDIILSINNDNGQGNPRFLQTLLAINTSCCFVLSADKSLTTNNPESSCPNSSFSKMVTLLANVLMVMSDELKHNMVSTRNYNWTGLIRCKHLRQLSFHSKYTLRIDIWTELNKGTSFLNSFTLINALYFF